MTRHSALAVVVALVTTVACKGTISGPPAPGGPGAVGAPLPLPVDCATNSTPISNEQVFEHLKGTCGGCHGASAEYPFFGSQTSFDALARNPNFVVPGQPADSRLLHMLNAEPGVTQMPPTAPYPSLAAQDPSLLSLGQLACWVARLAPNSSVAPVAQASLNRRLYAEYIKRNLQQALGLKPTDFSTGGSDMGLEDPDGLKPQSANNQARAQTLGSPHWLYGVPRNNQVGTAFIQITVQLSQAWCIKAAGGNPTFYKYAAATDGLANATSAPKVRANLAYLFERVTGESPDEETLRGLSELFARYEPNGTRAAWAAACSGIVRHPLSLSF